MNMEDFNENLPEEFEDDSMNFDIDMNDEEFLDAYRAYLEEQGIILRAGDTAILKADKVKQLRELCNTICDMVEGCDAEIKCSLNMEFQIALGHVCVTCNRFTPKMETFNSVIKQCDAFTMYANEDGSVMLRFSIANMTEIYDEDGVKQ